MEPGSWSDEDEKALNEAVSRFRDNLAQCEVTNEQSI